MILSKMKMDLGSIHVGVALLSSLLATVVADNMNNETVTETIDDLMLTGVPLTSNRIIFSFFFFVLTIGGHVASVKWLMPADKSMNFWLEKTSQFSSAAIFLVALAHSYAQDAIVLPFYVIDLGFPFSLVSLVVAVLIKFKLVDSVYFIENSAIKYSAAEVNYAFSSTTTGNAKVAAVTALFKKNYVMTDVQALNLLTYVSTNAENAVLTDLDEIATVQEGVDILVTQAKKILAKTESNRTPQEKSDLDNFKSIFAKKKSDLRLPGGEAIVYDITTTTAVPTPAEITAAFDTPGSGNATVTAVTAFLKKHSSYILTVSNALEFLAKVASPSDLAILTDPNQIEAVNKAISILVTKAKEIIAKGNKQSKEEKDELVKIKAQLGKKKADLRLIGGSDIVFQFPNENADFLQKVTDAVTATTTPDNVGAHFALFFNAWENKKMATETALKDKLVALFANIKALFDVAKFPDDAPKASASLVALRKVLFAFKHIANKTSPTFVELTGKGSTEFVFKDANTDLITRLKALVSADVVDKLGKAPINSLAIVKQIDSPSYTVKTVKSIFIVQFKQVMDLIDDEDADHCLFSDMVIEKNGPVIDTINQHIGNVKDLIRSIAAKELAGQSDANILNTTLKDFDSSKYIGTKNIFATELREMLSKCDPSAARLEMIESATTAIEKSLKEDSADAAKLIGTLIQGVKAYDECQGDIPGRAPIMTQLGKVKIAIEKIITDTLLLAFSVENVTKVKSLHALLTDKSADLPMEKFFVGAVEDKVFKNAISQLKGRLDTFAADITFENKKTTITEPTAALTAAGNDFKKLCAALKAAKGVLDAERSTPEPKVAKEVNDLKLAIDTAAKKVKEAMVAWATLTGANINTSEQLQELRANIADAKDIAAFTHQDLGMDATTAPYFDTDYKKLAEIEKAALKAIFIKASNDWYIPGNQSTDLRIPQLIERVIKILSIVPDKTDLEKMKKDNSDNELKEASGRLCSTIDTVVLTMTNQCSQLLKLSDSDAQQARICEILDTLKRFNLLASDGIFPGISTMKYCGAEGKLFKGEINALLKKLKPN